MIPLQNRQAPKVLPFCIQHECDIRTVLPTYNNICAIMQCLRISVDITSGGPLSTPDLKVLWCLREMADSRDPVRGEV